MACKHEHTYFDKEPWPTGESIEICLDCGESRAHWEQGESGWLMVDVEKERIKLQVAIEHL